MSSINHVDTSKAKSCSPKALSFLHLLSLAKALIQTHGPYTTVSASTVFCRATTPRDETDELSTKDAAISLATAQDCFYSTQPQGPANDDLTLFCQLWHTTTTLLKGILETKNLDLETLGWGVFGLTSGYMSRSSKHTDPLIHSYKIRLHHALKMLPSLDGPPRNWNAYRDYARSAGRTVHVLATARSEVHFCSTMLLQRFAQEQWSTIRWWHGVAVAERWAAKLAVETEGMVEEMIVQ